MNQNPHIFIVDDEAPAREMVGDYLKMHGFGVTLCDGGKSLRKEIESSTPDLVVLDLNMPVMGGQDGLGRMIEVAGDTPVAIISGVAQPDKVQAAIDAGARGFLPKTMSAKSISAAIRFMAAGEIYMPYALMQQGTVADGFDLKPRERDVLRGLAEGLSNKEIALKLDLQEVTVKLHIKTLSRKLNARNRTHAAMIARDNGLI
jgi:DNA-binding NarL/FixJ family response regulator